MRKPLTTQTRAFKLVKAHTPGYTLAIIHRVREVAGWRINARTAVARYARALRNIHRALRNIHRALTNLEK